MTREEVVLKMSEKLADFPVRMLLAASSAALIVFDALQPQSVEAKHDIGLTCERCHTTWVGENILDALKLGWVPINQAVDYYCPGCAPALKPKQEPPPDLSDAEKEYDAAKERTHNHALGEAWPEISAERSAASRVIEEWKGIAHRFKNEAYQTRVLARQAESYFKLECENSSAALRRAVEAERSLAVAVEAMMNLGAAFRGLVEETVLKALAEVRAGGKINRDRPQEPSGDERARNESVDSSNAACGSPALSELAKARKATEEFVGSGANWLRPKLDAERAVSDRLIAETQKDAGNPYFEARP